MEQAALKYDFRSDTVTRPSAAMRAAMAAAEVGDDVFGDDPTVKRLEARVAETIGKEAGLFVPSGTQSNLIALMTHCERGDEYIVGQQAHCYRWEAGGAAVLVSIQPQPLENAADGVAKGVKGRVTSRSTITVDGAPAVLMVLQPEDDYALSDLLIVKGDTLYQLMSIGHGALPKETDAFQKSFTFLASPTPGTP